MTTQRPYAAESALRKERRAYDANAYRNVIELGDRLFARVTRNGITMVELMTDRVGSLTDLLAEVRRSASGKRGLMKLYIRNHSKGWSTERPLMLYAGNAPRTLFGQTVARSESMWQRTERPNRMVQPWETH